MKVRVIKGTNQIGGCITEIATDTTKIIIDFGEDLVDEDKGKTKVIIPGLNDDGESLYQAVFVTHSHGDHIGLVNSINEDILVYVEDKGKEIHNLTSVFVKNSEEITRNTNDFKFEETIEVGDIKVTPYIVDHSSYNSCMFLIEADGKRVVHTGDYRGHGKKGKLFSDTLRKIGSDIDLLITEGTVFGRNDDKYKTEDELVDYIYENVKGYKQVLVMQSSTNIDRVSTMCKVSNKLGVPFIQDLFTSVLCSGIDRVPNPITYNGVYTWINSKYIGRENYREFVEKFERYRNYNYENGYLMLVKPSMYNDIKDKLYDNGYLDNACLVYSMWNGYLKDDYTNNFVKSLECLGVKYLYAHTSGHADILTMKRLNQELCPRMTIVIHTENKDKAKDVFNNVLDISDDMEVVL